MGETTTVTLIEGGGTAVGTIVDALTQTSTGMINVLKSGFDTLILNEAGTGLSMFAIWSLIFMGVALAPRMFKGIRHLFSKSKVD